MLGIFRRRPSPAMVVALVALFAALTGTAAALHGKNSVKSDDIKNGQVKSQDIGKNQVKSRNIGKGQVKNGDLATKAVTPSKTNLTKSSTVAAANVTAATSPTDLGGPSVQVKVPSGALVAIYAKAQISVTGSGNNGNVRLFEPTIVPNSPVIMQASSPPNSLQQRFTSPGSNDANGVGSQARAGWLVLSPPSGTYTFSLRYSTSGGTATFQNRSLFVTVLG
jgi:hypothetical protein